MLTITPHKLFECIGLSSHYLIKTYSIGYICHTLYFFVVIYSKIGHQHAKNIGVERQLSDRHMMACLYAGVKIGGSIRENGPSQVMQS